MECRSQPTCHLYPPSLVNVTTIATDRPPIEAVQSNWSPSVPRISGQVTSIRGVPLSVNPDSIAASTVHAPGRRREARSSTQPPVRPPSRPLGPAQAGGVLVRPADGGVHRDPPIQLAGGVGLATSRARILSQVPSALNRRCRFHTVCHGPYGPGGHATRSRPGTGTRSPRSPDGDRGTGDRCPSAAATARSAPTHRQSTVHATWVNNRDHHRADF